MSDMLFDPPWWLPLGIIAVGAYLFWSANRKQDTTLRNVGLGVVLLAVVLMAIGYFVDTPTETAVRRTRLLITSVEDRDWTTFASLLDSKTSLLVYRGKEQLSKGAEQTIDRIGLQSVRILDLEARPTQSLITVDLSLLSEQEIAPYPYPSNWRFEWQTDGNGWYLARIVPLPRENFSPDDVSRNLVLPTP
ncbi:MAG TPA: hypothetical protein VGN72_23295 [Tepidisphaeraceae bacterium]|jgi:hypothetical protein|nr:hypothetical protein [Tepidisphaeraceae bacterium]